MRIGNLDSAARLRDHFVEAMSRGAFTVSIAATDGQAGRAGITVSAMTSVSADPPTLLVCVNRQSHFASNLAVNKRFCVSLLNSEQSGIADVFAGRTDIGDRFTIGDWQSSSLGMPVLAHAVAAFDCELLECKAVGTHDVAIGLVRDVHYGADSQRPLIHHRRHYGVPEMTREEV